MLACIKKRNKVYLKYEPTTHYWKYVYETWTQPVLTSNTSGNCTVTFNAKYSDYDGYKAMDGSTTNCWFPNTSTGWWQIKFPQKILIKDLTHIAGAYSQQTQAIQGRYYTSSDKSIPIGNTINGTYTQGTNVVIEGIPFDGIETDTIYFAKTGGHANAGIGELIIDAQIKTIVEATQDDYDFTTIEHKYSAFMKG